MLKHVLIAAFLASAPLVSSTALAAGKDAEDAKHHGKPGPHGGKVEDLGPYHAELAVKDGMVRLWLQDHDTKAALDPKGLQASALLTVGDKPGKPVTLKAEGDHLAGPTDAGAPSKAVVTLRGKDGKTSQATFEMQ